MLAEVTHYQWGMVTSAQADLHGITRLDLSRLATGGHLNRLSHGVYQVTDAPDDQFEEIRAAWLSSEPKRLAYERTRDLAQVIVIAGTSAARVHGIGDIWERNHDFISPVRRQSQRAEIRYRQRVLEPTDVTLIEGLPVLSLEATIADLFNTEADLPDIAGALRDGARKRRIDAVRLTDLLAPYAARHRLRRGDGEALLQRLMDQLGLNPEFPDLIPGSSSRETRRVKLAKLMQDVG